MYLAAGALSLSVLADASRAQVGGHATIAEPLPNAVIHSPQSPFLNRADLLWNHGEALPNPRVPDVGGFAGPDPDPAAALASVVRPHPAQLDDGACGLAAADLDNDPSTIEILVSTHLGEISIFRWDVPAKTLVGPVDQILVDGSIGAYQSIVIADLDHSSPAPEVYLAGANGIRRLDPVITP